MSKIKNLILFGLTAALGGTIIVGNSFEDANVTNVDAATFSGGTVLYLKPNSNWTQASAWFAMYCFNRSGGNAWAQMYDGDGDGIYSGVAPTGSWTNVIFTRMNPSNTAFSWGNGKKWNQTGDLNFTSDKPLYTVPDGSWDSSGDNWSALTNYLESGAAVYLETDFYGTTDNNSWNIEGAVFSIYCFNDMESAWSPLMTQINCAQTTYFETILPVSEKIGKWIGINAVRLEKGTTTPDWSNKKDQTSNIETTYHNHLSITITGWDDADFTISNTFTANSRASCYADYFLQETGNVCNGDETNLTNLTSAWTNLQNEYNKMHDDAKAIISNNEDTGDVDIQSAIERYDFIINKYNTFTDFANRKNELSGIRFLVSENSSTNTLTGTTILILVTVSIIGICLIVKKRKSLSK